MMTRKPHIFSLLLLTWICFIQIGVGALIEPPPPPSPTPTLTVIPTAPAIPAPPVTTSPTETTTTSNVAIPAGSTVFPNIASYSGSLLTEMGDLAKLHEDYVKITVKDPAPYVKTETSGISITDFTRDGVIGTGPNNASVYKYRLTSEFYLLVYSAYPVTHFYSLTPEIRAQEWLHVDTAGALTWDVVLATYKYYLYYKHYSAAGAANKPNGGAFDLPVDVSFALPAAGQTIGNYKIMNLQSTVVSLQTAPTAAEIGLISSTDPKFSSQTQSGKATSYTTKQAVTGINFGDMSFYGTTGALDAEIARVQPGWMSETGNPAKITDNSMNLVAMGTNSRIGTGGASSLTGTYKCNIGAQAYHYTNTINIKFAKIRVDIRGPWTGALTQDVRDIAVSRNQGVGVDNFYIKQKMRVVFEIYSELATLGAQSTPQQFTTATPPAVVNESITFDTEVTGDMNATVQGVDGIANQMAAFVASPTFTWILIGVGALTVTIVVFVVIIRFRLLSPRR